MKLRLLAEKRTLTNCDLELGDYLNKDEDYYVSHRRVDIEYLYGINGLNTCLINNKQTYLFLEESKWFVEWKA